jgi:outer membrane protein OmpA-like peptidoglycan-associated protein
VEKTAQARITGKINPWNAKQPLDLKISLQSMDLLAANPYSSKYLGYELKQGKLSAQLGYEVTERKLKSENRLTLDQLTLGQKVESADATRLPVRLAIALLKDRDGRIALDLPFSGSLDDPQFNLGGVVAHALESIVARIVTSPFSALGALFGGKGQELSFQEFQPGSTNLLPAALVKLDVLAQALYERPELQLEIEGSADAVIDLETLRRTKFNGRLPLENRNAVANLFLTATNAAVQKEPPARNNRKEFSFEKGSTALRSPVAYWSRTPAIDENDRSSHRARPFADDKGATALMLIFAPVEGPGGPDEQRELLEAVEISPNALRTLANERAENVKAYLVQTGKVEPRRITDSARGDSSKGSRVYLWLK